MQAMVLHQRASIHTAALRWGEVATPVPGPGEVRLRVRCCAICRTDLHVIEGDLPQQKLPIIPGHQIVGVVDAVGTGCRQTALGQRVGVAWLRHTCGACDFCGAGRENLCESARFTGYHADGGYAEYAVVPEESSVTCNTRADGRELLADAAAIPLRPHTTVYPLADANRALEDLKRDRIQGTGVLVTRGFW